MTKKTKYLFSILFIALSVALILLFLIVDKMNKNEIAENQQIQRALSQSLTDRNAGRIESIHLQEESYVGAVYYPVFDMENIDRTIINTIDKIMSEFILIHQNENINAPAILNVDYNSYQINDRFVSVYFETTYHSPMFANVVLIPQTMLLDVENDDVLDSSEFFKDGYLDRLSSLSMKALADDEPFEEGLDPIPDNYKNIVFKKDGIVIVFEKYQILPGYKGQKEYFIEYSKLNDFLKYDTQGKIIEEKPPVVVEPKPEEAVVEPAPIVENTNKQYVAFTFDDGPYPEVTDRIVSAFEKVQGHATFFVVGNRVGQYGQSVVNAYQKGNQIGNHSFNHPSLAKLGEVELAQQINSTNEVVQSIIGESPQILRPTFGEVSDLMLNQVTMPMINWDVDSLDWKSRNTQTIVDTVMQNIKPNSIVLMHDLYPTTAEAVEILIEKLSALNYEFVTINQLAQLNGQTLNAGQVYWSIIK